MLEYTSCNIIPSSFLDHYTVPLRMRRWLLPHLSHRQSIQKCFYCSTTNHILLGVTSYHPHTVNYYIYSVTNEKYLITFYKDLFRSEVW